MEWRIGIIPLPVLLRPAPVGRLHKVDANALVILALLHYCVLHDTVLRRIPVRRERVQQAAPASGV